MGDLLAFSLWPPTSPPPPPPRHPHLAHHAVFDLPIIHSRAGVAHRMPGQADFRVELGRCLRGVECRLKLRPLIFLNSETANPSGTSFNLERHLPHETVPRRREAAGEGAVVIRLLLLAGYLLAV